MTAPGRERGSATLWLVAGCLLLFLTGTVATVRAEAVAARHRAETAADLAALAAAGSIGTGAEPCAAAQEIAARNGAHLLSCRSDLAPDGRSGTVNVRVEISVRLPVVGARSTAAGARAERMRSAAADAPPSDGTTQTGAASDAAASDAVTSDAVTSNAVTSNAVTSNAVTSDAVTSGG